jgi:hypothetical protein
VIQCGRIRLGKDRMYYSTVFGGQMVGIREVADQIWLVSFMQYDLSLQQQLRVNARTLTSITIQWKSTAVQICWTYRSSRWLMM